MQYLFVFKFYFKKFENIIIFVSLFDYIDQFNQMFTFPSTYPYYFKVITENDIDYLDVFGQENPDKKYLLKFSDQSELNALTKRYMTPTRIPGLGQGINIFRLNMMQMQSHQSYQSPKLGDGWFNITKVLGHLEDMNDIAQFENSLIFDPAIHSPFLKQSTAHYASNNDSVSTVVETKYSASVVEFHFVDYDGHIVIFVEFYYKGVDATDIPIDLQMCLDKYGKYDLKNKS